MKNKPKIIISNYDDVKNPYYGGGGAMALLRISKKLSNKYEITILTGRYPSSKDETISGIKHIRIGSNTNFPKLDQLVFQFALPYYVHKLSFDLWAENFTPPFSTAFLPMFTKKPVVGISQMSSAKTMVEFYKLPFFAWIERFGIQKYKYLVFLTSEMKKQFEPLDKKQFVRLIPNTVDFAFYKTPCSKPKNYFLFLGRIAIHHKGLDLLLSSFKLAAKTIDSDLYIAGDGKKSEVRMVKDMVRKLGLTNRVKFFGWVKGSHKKELIRNAIAMTVTSRQEGQSIVALESIASLTPIICFKAPGLDWIENKVSCKVAMFNCNQFSEKMVLLRKNKRVRNKLATACLDYKEKTTWSNIANRYDSLFKKILYNKNIELN